MTIMIDIDLIDANPFNVREHEDGGSGEPSEHVQALAESILSQGLMQAPVGRRRLDAAGRFELAFGHSRLAAFKLLVSQGNDKYKMIPLNLAPLADEQMFEMGVSENLKRKNLTPLEEAQAMLLYREKFGKTSAEIGELFGLSESAVRNKIRLLELPEECQDALSKGGLLEGAARELLTMYGLPEEILEKAKHQWNDEYKPKVISEQAKKGASAEYVRERVDYIVNQYSENLHAAPWKHDTVYEGENILGICKGCEKRINRENKTFCLNKTCYQAKLILWRRELVREASEASGIPLLEPEVSNPTRLDDYDDPGKKIRQGSCENRRLIYGVGDCEDVPGYPKTQVVCVKQNNSCSCLKGLKLVTKDVGYGKTLERSRIEVEKIAESMTPEDLAETAREARIEKQKSRAMVSKLREWLEHDFTQGLIGYDNRFFLMLLEAISWGAAVQVRETVEGEPGWEDIAEFLAWEAVKRIMPDSYNLDQSQDPARLVLKRINDVRIRCGLEEMGITQTSPLQLSTVASPLRNGEGENGNLEQVFVSVETGAAVAAVETEETEFVEEDFYAGEDEGEDDGDQG